MKKRLLALLLAWAAWVPTLTHGTELPIETPDLVVVDGAGDIGPERLQQLADEAQTMLGRVTAFWAVDAGTARWGKMRLVFERPRAGGYYTAVVQPPTRQLGQGPGVRTVRVFGYAQTPQELAHKMANALFMSPDKLVRNLIGVATEEAVGFPLSWPMCGFPSDAWVLALLKADAYIPLQELGPEHESWGMTAGRDGFPRVLDRSRQSRAYAEVGSFGRYLIRRYGIAAVKLFHARAASQTRPWQAIFGLDLAGLEAAWLASLEANAEIAPETVATLADLVTEHPAMACFFAQGLAKPR